MKKLFKKKIWPWIAHPVETAKMTVLKFAVGRVLKILAESRRAEIEWLSGALGAMAGNLDKLAKGQVKPEAILKQAESAYKFFRGVVKRVKEKK